MEVWKDVVGYEGLYQISNKGNVFSIYKGKPLKICTHPRGYLMCGLYKDGKQLTKRVHRLVAQAFIPNPDNLPQVNHKDENKGNNCVENLEWCTDEYNRYYGTGIERNAKIHRKNVVQYSLDGKYIRTWEGINETARQLNIQASHIIECCQGKLNSTGGFVWKYEEGGCSK
jgi:hypothetical protein